MMSDQSMLPAPPVPPDIDLRSHCWMKLDMCRLFSSDFIALSTGDEFKAALVLWAKSMQQVPAGSLPDDDTILAYLAGYGRNLRSWRKVRPMALHGWTLCSDGRYYHPVLAEMVLDTWAHKPVPPQENPADRRAKDRERLRRWRAERLAKKQAGREAEDLPMKGHTDHEGAPETAGETFQKRFTETFPETPETFPINREETEEKREEKNNMFHERFTETFPETPAETGGETPPPVAPESSSITREGTLCKQLRALGVRAAPHMTVVQEMCSRHSDEHILAAAEIALEKKGAGIHVGYIAAMLKNSGSTRKGAKNKPPAGPPNRELIPPVAIGSSHFIKL